MNIKQVIKIKENLIELRQMAVDILNENQPDSEALALYIHERCNAIEQELPDDSQLEPTK